MSWRRIDLLNPDDEAPDELWRAAWAVSGASPTDATNAVFRRTGAGAAIFFSPQAQELARVFSAYECDPPNPHGLHLVAGNPGAWGACFPGAPEGGDSRDPVAHSTQYVFVDTLPTHFDDPFQPTIPSVL
jgi:hypothetical protein